MKITLWECSSMFKLLFYFRAVTSVCLAVLHPRRLSVYTLVSTTGAVAHGSQYKLQHVYSHNLQRTSFNMCHGPFGQVKGEWGMTTDVMVFSNLSVFMHSSRIFPNLIMYWCPCAVYIMRKWHSEISSTRFRQIILKSQFEPIHLLQHEHCDMFTKLGNLLDT